MTVQVERPFDGGSSIWSCSTCSGGGWCSDHTSALMEARTHASGHGVKVQVIGLRPGRQPDSTRDLQINTMRAQGATLRVIAASVGMTTSGVLRALRRTTA